MQVAYVGQQSASNESENFLTMEKKLLNHLCLVERQEAHQAIREVMKYVLGYEESQKNVAKYYLVALSSMMARTLESSTLDESCKTLTFNIACFTLIDSKLNDTNAIEVADELIEFYMYVLMGKKRPILSHNTVNHVIQYIDGRVESSLTVEEIAKHFNVSTSHLSRIFREHTGSTLVEYINICKVEESQYHLRFSDKKIADISDQFFFCNQSYFTRIFKKYTGQTPRKFRSCLTGEYFQFVFPQGKKQILNGQSL